MGKMNIKDHATSFTVAKIRDDHKYGFDALDNIKKVMAEIKQNPNKKYSKIKMLILALKAKGYSNLPKGYRDKLIADKEDAEILRNMADAFHNLRNYDRQRNPRTIHVYCSTEECDGYELFDLCLESLGYENDIRDVCDGFDFNLDELDELD